MDTQRVAPVTGNDLISMDGEELSRAEVLQQVDRLVSSRHFKNSKRYPSFLKFIVEKTLQGHVDGLKERTLGTEVFSRASDYDTNADPIVRVTAGEIRKRIAQYYQDPGHEGELRIDLPLGSYVPHFHHALHASREPGLELVHGLSALAESEALHFTSAAVTTVASEPGHAEPASAEPGYAEAVGGESGPAGGRKPRWHTLLPLSIMVALILVSAGLLGNSLAGYRFRDQGLNYFWKPIVTSPAQALIVIGVHSIDSTGQTLPTETYAGLLHEGKQDLLSSMDRWDMVPISDIVSYSKVTDLLTRHTHAYRTQGAAETKLEELRHGPVILIGGLDNVWTMRLSAPLRFKFLRNGTTSSGIEDREHPTKTLWFDNMQPARGNTRDYAIVASYYVSTIEQHVVIAAGIGKSGTEAAAEFLTSDKYLSSWLAEAKLPRNKNVELVLSTDVLDGQPGPPHVLAASWW